MFTARFTDPASYSRWFAWSQTEERTHKFLTSHSEVYEKTPEERASLSNIIKTSRDGKIHMLFGTVNQETFEKIMDAMFIKKIAKGEDVIRQGDEGDYFYIVKKGDFDIYVRKGEDPPKKAGGGRVFLPDPGQLSFCLGLATTAVQRASLIGIWCIGPSVDSSSLGGYHFLFAQKLG